MSVITPFDGGIYRSATLGLKRMLNEERKHAKVPLFSHFEIDNVLLIPGFYSPKECEEELAFAQQSGFLTQRYGSRESTWHDRKRAFIDHPERAGQIWQKLNRVRSGERTVPALETFFEGFKPDPIVDDLPKWKPIGLNERLRYYNYEIGQQFSRHFDILYRINDDTRTFLTFICYLNDEFEGGQTIFDSGVILPKAGDAILFPHELKHEGAVVTKGVKTILRSDVIYQKASGDARYAGDPWDGNCPRCQVSCSPSNMYCCPKCGWDANV